MDHDYIEEHQVADRYVRGTLPEDEAERFEDHFFSCPECMERIEIARSMQRGFQRVAREDATVLTSARQLAVVAWLARLGRSRQLGVLFVAAVALAALPAGLSWRALSVEKDMKSARSDRLEAERQHSAAAQKVAALEAELEKGQRELAREVEARTQAARQLAQALQPRVNDPYLRLEVERDAGSPGGEPTYRLRQPEGTGWVGLELVPDSSQSLYRAVLKDSKGRQLWSRTGLHLTNTETLRLSLPRSLVPPDDYTVVVEGLPPGGKPIPAGRFTFRILPSFDS